MTNVEVTEVSDGELKYPVNPLNAINEGCVLDLRVRMAAEFLKAGVIGAYAEPTDTAPPQLLSSDERAGAALDLAESFMREAEARGWVQMLAEDSNELPKVVKRHVEVHALAQMHANEFAQKQMRAGAAIMAPGMPLPAGARFPQ